MIYAGIVAGGQGIRMGAGIPKQFMHIGEKPIFIHTLEKFLPVADVIYVACPAESIEYTKNLVDEYIGSGNIRIIAGGATRMQSMLSIMSATAADGAAETDIILTHDGIRPFVSKPVIDANIAAAKKHSACGTYVGAIDTIAVSEDGKCISAIPPRDTMLHAQTPQTFKFGVLKKLFEKNRETLEEYTDLCGMAHASGVKVYIVEGNRENIKITNPVDLKTAEGILENV